MRAFIIALLVTCACSAPPSRRIAALTAIGNGRAVAVIDVEHAGYSVAMIDSSGNVVWSTPARDVDLYTDAMTTSSDKLLVRYRDGLMIGVRCYALATGELRWTRSLALMTFEDGDGRRIGLDLLVANANVIVATQSRAFVVSLDTGEVKGMVQVKSFEPLIVTNHHLVVQTDEVITSTNLATFASSSILRSPRMCVDDETMVEIDNDRLIVTPLDDLRAPHEVAHLELQGVLEDCGRYRGRRVLRISKWDGHQSVNHVTVLDERGRSLLETDIGTAGGELMSSIEHRQQSGLNGVLPRFVAYFARQHDTRELVVLDLETGHVRATGTLLRGADAFRGGDYTFINTGELSSVVDGSTGRVTDLRAGCGVGFGDVGDRDVWSWSKAWSLGPLSVSVRDIATVAN